MTAQIIRDYFFQFVCGIADEVWIQAWAFVALSVVIIGVALWRRKSLKVPSAILLCVYICIILLYTLLHRGDGSVSGYNFMPFWSYRAIYDGQLSLVIENGMNVILFIPVGMLVGLALPRIAFKHVIVYAFLISIFIEVMQYMLSKGFAEFDDVIHNTLGCAIGFGIMKQIKIFRNKIVKR